MLDLKEKPTLDCPDDPLKWDGWSKYKSDNLYERLCLDQRAKPGDEQIQQHCTALLQWWQKKVRFKDQPSNPLAQMLRGGIDEASNYLVQAQMQLLDPVRRVQIDEELAAKAQQEALAEFSKYVAFSIAGKLLTAEAEANLVQFGERNGLTEEQTRACIEEQLQRNKAQRAAPGSAPTPVPAAPEAISSTKAGAEAEEEFHRILRLSHLDLGDATMLVRRLFITIADSLGIHLERAERLLEDYLDQEEWSDGRLPLREPRVQPPPVAKRIAVAPAKPTPPAEPAKPAKTASRKAPSTRVPAGFVTPNGVPMMLIPGGEFVMGSNAPDAGPDEQPLNPLILEDFYMSRHPVTNAQYEQFDPSHKQKRMQGVGGDHPVVYVTSLEAENYCQWLSQKDGKNYRLPTEAEWEYAARGTDDRKYPWGNQERRGDFANFADATTTFPWRDPQIRDGYPQTSPVGAFPRGASFFGLEDMAGNVWEWCQDIYQPVLGARKPNPRASAAPTKRVYRGGSWKSRFSNLRATARSSNAPNYSCNDVGFRIACDCGADDPDGKADPDTA